MRTRALAGRVPLYFTCRRCGRRICSTSPLCGCQTLLEQANIDSSWKILDKKFSSRSSLKGKLVKVKIRCKFCGVEHWREPAYLQAGAGCLCQIGKKIGKSRLKEGQRKFESRLKERRIRVRLLSPYLGANRKIRYQCLVHPNIEREAYASNLGSGHGCPECGRKKYEETSLKNYGTKWPASAKVVQDKIRRTMVKRYGVEHALQSPLLFEKMLKSSYSRVPVKLGRKTLLLQGYEPLAIEALLKSGRVSPQEIKAGNSIPPIEYTWKKKRRRYHPDLVVRDNIVVEVKSPYTYKLAQKVLQVKREACENLGYKFILVVMNADGTRNHDCK